MSIGINPLCFLWQRCGAIKIKNNVFGEGYDTLCFYHKDYEEDIEEIKMTTDEILLTDFEQSGIYYFYVMNSEKETSLYHTVYIINEDKEKLFKKLRLYVGKQNYNGFIEEKMEELEKAVSLDTEYILYELLAIMDGIEDIQQHERFYLQSIMQTVEQYENVQNIVLNENIHDISFDYGPICSIRVNDYVTHIDIIRYDNTGTHFDARIQTEEDVARYPLLLTENALFHIKLYNNEDLLGNFIHYQFDEDTLANMWHKKINISYNTEDDIFQDLLIDQEDLEFTSEEKKLLIEEKNNEKKNWIIPRLVAEKGPIFGDVYLFIDRFENLAAQNKNFYIVAKESDCFLDNTFERSQLINDKEVVFNTYKHNLSNACTFYIKDDKDKIISKYTRYSHDLDYEDYEEKKNKLEIAAYASQLAKTINSVTSMTGLQGFILASIESTSQIPGAVLEDALVHLIDDIHQADMLPIPKNNLIYIILENWFKQFDFASDFIPYKTVAYFHADNRLIIPRCKGAGYAKLITFSHSGDINVAAYELDDKDTTTIYLNEQGSLNLIYIVDGETYGRSGFLLINTLPNDKCLLSNTLTIEVDPDDK